MYVMYNEEKNMFHRIKNPPIKETLKILEFLYKNITKFILRH